MASEYERIRRQCLKRGELWEDTEFPTTQTSIFYHQSPPFQFVWKRPKELATNPVFIREGTSVLDVVPGKLGDRWLVSTLGCLFLTKGFFYRVVPADQGFDTALDGTNSSTGYCGAFRFRVWWCGEWVEVTVDDRLPTVNGRLVFAHCLNSGQFWPCLLEKAYAKLHGSYEALKYGTTLDGLADLTGGVTESLSVVGGGHINKDTSFHVRLLARLLANTSILTAVAHRPTTTTGTIQQQQQQQPNSLTSPQPNNKENNNNNNSLSSCNSSSTTTSNGLTTTKEQSLQQQQQSSRSVTDRLPIGILVGINYKICAVDKVDTLTEESVPLLRLRCPYGRHGESTGDWSRGDAKNWETSVSVSAAERERLGPDQLPDGEFYLSFPDFIATFTAIECVHLDAETSRDEPTLQGRGTTIAHPQLLPNNN